MIRIDENTYIDDTLVTCAEYQLFIDEMREQGKYYQPDHWTSGKFPAGQGFEPILGVRRSDASEFCAWLANREPRRWFYRLPTTTEGQQIPLTSCNQFPAGYWTIDPDNKAGYIVHNVKKLKPFQVDPTIFKIDSKTDRTFIHQIKHIISLLKNHPLDIDTILSFLHSRREYLDSKYELYYGTAMVLGGNPRNPTTDAIAHSSFQVSHLTRAIDRSFLDEQDKIAKCYILKYPNEQEVFHSSSLFDMHSHVFDIAKDTIFDLLKEHEYSRASGLYIEITMLQERIAGRSPAFEGIRLVKERKQS
jgi:hypothetical protein